MCVRVCVCVISLFVVCCCYCFGGAGVLLLLLLLFVLVQSKLFNKELQDFPVTVKLCQLSLFVYFWSCTVHSCAQLPEDVPRF